MNKLTVSMISLGCSKNLVDTEVMMGYLQEAGHPLILEPEDAQVVVINTCGFIDSAKEESIDNLLSTAKQKVDGGLQFLIAAGCLSQRFAAELLVDLPEVDAFIGSSAYPQIAEVIQRLVSGERGIVICSDPNHYLNHASMPRVQATQQATAYLKIADGCDNHCSYCAIPAIRGSFRSRSMDDVVAEAQRMLTGGVREVCLVAHDTTRYGVDRNESMSLVVLCKELLPLPGLHWLRILYCHPAHISDDLLELMATEPKLCSYLDIPVQHAADGILQAMNRPYTGKDMLELVAKARRLVPGVTLRSSLIVGFPGEGEEEFQVLKEFVQQAAFDHLGVFTYSQEEGTPAALLPSQLSKRVKEARFQEIMELQKDLVSRLLTCMYNKEIEVLVERQVDAEMFSGRCQGQAPDVDGRVLLCNSEAQIGEFVNAVIYDSRGYDLVGRKV